jgi:hypothetical protein
MLRETETPMVDAEQERIRIHSDDDHDAFCDMANFARSLERRNAALTRAAEAVVWFDWSGNDDDAVRAIEKLRAALAQEKHDE